METERFISFPELKHLIGNRSRTTIWRWVRTGHFPSPHKIGPNSSAWLESDVKEWCKQITEPENNTKQRGQK